MSDTSGAVGRGSDTHSPRVDDQLSHEIDALVHGAPDEGRTEGRRQEDPPGLDNVVRGDLEPAVAGLDETDLELRAALASHLAAATWPASVAHLGEVARRDFAPDEVLEVLDRLPEGQTFRTVSEVWSAAGGTVEHRGD